VDVPLTTEQAKDCTVYVLTFAQAYHSPREPCTAPTVYKAQWANYKRGFAVMYDLGESLSHCLQLATTSMHRQAMCKFIESVVTGCGCDKTVCYTKQINSEIRTANKGSSCDKVPQSYCAQVQATFNPICLVAVRNANDDLPRHSYNESLVDLNCAPSNCPAVNGSFNTITTTFALVAGLVSLLS